jgi:hypothetical protein
MTDLRSTSLPGSGEPLLHQDRIIFSTLANNHAQSIFLYLKALRVNPKYLRPLLGFLVGLQIGKELQVIMSRLVPRPSERISPD